MAVGARRRVVCQVGATLGVHECVRTDTNGHTDGGAQNSADQGPLLSGIHGTGTLQDCMMKVHQINV